VKLVAVHSVQIADETFVAADPARVGAFVADPANWRRWWPDLRLEVTEERGPLGVRWAATGPLTGTMEIWLEPMLDVRGGGLETGQAQPLENDASASGRGQENGLRSKDDAGTLPSGRGFSDA
jgi:hypothetical protein